MSSAAAAAAPVVASMHPKVACMFTRDEETGALTLQLPNYAMRSDVTAELFTAISAHCVEHLVYGTIASKNRDEVYAALLKCASITSLHSKDWSADTIDFTSAMLQRAGSATSELKLRMYNAGNQLMECNARLRAAVAESRTLTSLQLNTDAINGGTRAWCEVMKKNRSITDVHFARIRYDPQYGLPGGDVIALFDALQAGGRIKRLDLDSCFSTPSGIDLFLYRLRDRSTLTQLGLSGNMMSATGWGSIAALLTSDRCELQSLDVSNCECSAAGAAAIAESLKRNSRLTDLRLANNRNIGAKGSIVLAESLEKNISIQLIDLSSCGVEERGAAALGTALLHNTTLKSLLLSFNHEIGSKGTLALASSLSSNCTLSQLDVLACGIGDVGASALASSIRSSTALRQLDISCNAIKDAGALAIAASLKRNMTLTSLVMYTNDFTDVGLAAIAGALQQNATLTCLYIFGSPGIWTLTGLDSFLTLISSNTSITRIELSGLEPAHNEKLQQYLARNRAASKQRNAANSSVSAAATSAATFHQLAVSQSAVGDLQQQLEAEKVRSAAERLQASAAASSALQASQAEL
ncbi:MAG: hypothetical protein O7C59_03705, partial [Rickettsia endosymbiont of Ixodes persulcatus]|nr:hypothetical protein [Rickettsia endosymbiont of Ixodes persulcatus]